MSKVNCAIYVRKSTEKGLEQEFNSLNNQEDACKAYILSQAFNQWEYYKTYEDGGISGGTMKRPGLQQMIKDLKEGKIQTIVVYKVDRLSRSIMDFHNMMKEFDKYGCNFVSITQAFDTSNSMGKLTLNMLLSFAQFEREISSERIRDKIQSSKRRGMWTGGSLILGYDIIDKKLVVNEAEREQVKLIFNKYLELQSIKGLKDFLNEARIPNKTWVSQSGKKVGGKDFCTSTLSLLLRQVIYAGKIKANDGIYKGIHEAIIDKTLFSQVQEVLSKNSNNVGHEYIKGQYLLHSKLFSNNGAMFTNQKSSKSKVHKYRYYTIKGTYLSAPDIENITYTSMEVLLNSDLSILNEDIGHDFKSINWLSLNEKQKFNLTKEMVEKAIYSESKITYYIKLKDISYLQKFKAENYQNTIKHNPSDKMYLSNDKQYLIIEKEIFINNRISTNIYKTKGRNILQKSENAGELIKALSYAWQYKKLYDSGITVNQIKSDEHKGKRTIYKYLKLSYLSPNIISSILDSQIPHGVNLQTLFEMSGEVNFTNQEKIFYKC